MRISFFTPLVAKALLLLSGCQVVTTETNSPPPLLVSVTQPVASNFQVQDFTAEGVFTDGIEGPAVDAFGNLYVVNYKRQGTIGVAKTFGTYKGKTSKLLTLPEGSIGNGIRFNRAGQMLVADYTGHNILKIEPRTQQISVLAHKPHMHQPNDLAISDTDIVFASDPNWADNTGQLWRIMPDSQVTLLEANMGTTNGIEVSPDNRYLYVNESVQRRIWRYDLSADGHISNKQLFYQFHDFGLDGMRCDERGNLFVARYGAGTVAMLSPAGDLIREVHLKGRYPTNLAFGGADGRDIFVTLQKRGAIETFRVPYAGRAFELWQKQ